jgi:hypothetical protein
MNLQQFAALKPGDKIENVFSNSRGEVTEASNRGVSLRWSDSSPPFFYSVNSTAWMHWSKVDEN